MKKVREKKSENSLQSYAKYSSLAFQMLFIILAGVFAGRLLDQWIGLKTPIFTAILALASVILSVYYAVKDLLKKP